MPISDPEAVAEMNLRADDANWWWNPQALFAHCSAVLRFEGSRARSQTTPWTRKNNAHGIVVVHHYRSLVELFLLPALLFWAGRPRVGVSHFGRSP